MKGFLYMRQRVSLIKFFFIIHLLIGIDKKFFLLEQSLVQISEDIVISNDFDK